MPQHPNDFKATTTPDRCDGSESSLRKLNRLQNQMVATAGSKVIAPGGAVTPTGQENFCAIQCVQECVFSDLTGNVDDVANLEGEVVPAGTVIFGIFTSVTLTSGLAIGIYE